MTSQRTGAAGTSRLSRFLAAVVIGTAAHIDWHLARGHHYPHSGNWPYHWTIAIPVFAALAWYAGRDTTFRNHVWLIVPGLILAQLLEPLFEIAFLGDRKSVV